MQLWCEPGVLQELGEWLRGKAGEQVQGMEVKEENPRCCMASYLIVNVTDFRVPSKIDFARFILILVLSCLFRFCLSDNII